VPGDGDKNTVKPAAPAAAPTPAAAAAPTPAVSAARSFFDRHRTIIVIAVLILAAAAVLAFVLRSGSAEEDRNRLVLYGNVDMRQVNLAFNNSERIAEVLVQEGAKVRRGEILARLDTSRLKPLAAAAVAEVQAQQAVATDCITAAGRRRSSRPAPMSRRRGRTRSTPVSSGPG